MPSLYPYPPDQNLCHWCRENVFDTHTVALYSQLESGNGNFSDPFEKRGPWMKIIYYDGVSLTRTFKIRSQSSERQTKDASFALCCNMPRPDILPLVSQQIFSTTFKLSFNHQAMQRQTSNSPFPSSPLEPGQPYFLAMVLIIPHLKAAFSDFTRWIAASL
jgi:hypothetical protein